MLQGAGGLSMVELVGPALAALLFIAAMSAWPDPGRRQFNAILVAGAGAAYLGSGLGPWELAYVPLATFVAYRGLANCTWIGVAWFMHTAWDVVHHHVGTPIWPFMASSSAGCAIFDAVIGCWFIAGMPALTWARVSRVREGLAWRRGRG